MCCRLAARRMTPEDQQQLIAAHEACRTACAAGDADDYYAKNEVFHQSIYAGSHNLFLQDQTRALHRRLRPYRRLQLRVRDRLAASLAEHQGVVDALIQGDGELAATRIRDHIMVQGQRFADLIASLSQIKAIAA
jgi:DNA-binding GntR family transcriptional regulator